MSRHDEWPLINIIMPLGLLVSLLRSICVCTHRVRLVYGAALFFHLSSSSSSLSFSFSPHCINLFTHPSSFLFLAASLLPLKFYKECQDPGAGTHKNSTDLQLGRESYRASSLLWATAPRVGGGGPLFVGSARPLKVNLQTRIGWRRRP